MKNNSIDLIHIAICKQEEALSLLKQAKKECKDKEIKELVKEAKKLNKKLNKLYIKLHDKNSKAEEDLVLEDTKSSVNKPFKNNEDSTVNRDKLIENTKKTKIKKSDTVIKEIKLDELKLEYTIDSQPGRLPVDCHRDRVQCIYTPQKTVIIKGGNVLKTIGIDTCTLSIKTRKNIAKAIDRGDLIKENTGDIEIYKVKGNITCSSKLDALKIIVGNNDVKNLDLFVKDMPLTNYLNLDNK